MLKLQNNPILLPYQIQILKSFFGISATHHFFLTGGTALAAFYYAHRNSKDFDLFSIEDFSFKVIDDLMADIAKKAGATVSVKVVSPTYKEIYLENKKENWIQRIDIVREQPKRFGRIATIENIRVDSLENMATNKILALYSRLEPKDYIDLYLILMKSKWTFDRLFKMAKEKDTGLFEFYFANSISGIEKIETWPEVIIQFDKKKMIQYYKNLFRKLLLSIKPKE
jgi:predicted nucleotidyltransferase component of viral defense system